MQRRISNSTYYDFVNFFFHRSRECGGNIRSYRYHRQIWQKGPAFGGRLLDDLYHLYLWGYLWKISKQGRGAVSTQGSRQGCYCNGGAVCGWICLVWNLKLCI